MAAMNAGDMSDLELTPGGDLNLDDDALFAELDGEVMAGGEAASGDLDLDLGDVSGVGAGDDLDLDLGGGPSAGGDLDMDLDIGDASGATAGADDMGLGDLGGDSAGGLGDDLDLDLGVGATEGTGDDLDLDLGDGAADTGDVDIELDAGGGGDADIDLDLGGDETASNSMDLDLGAGEDAAGDIDLNLDEGIGEAEAPAGDAMDLGLAEDTDLSAADEIDLGALGEEEPAEIGEDMESLELDVGEADLDDLDLGAVDSGLVDTDPITEPEPMVEEDLAAPELAVESMEIPDEPVFDIDAAPAAAPETEFHAAEDIRLDEEPLQLDLEDTGTAPAPSAWPAAEEDMIELVDEGPLALEPDMIAEPAMDFEPVSPPAPEADTEFSAVQDVQVDDDALLELNLDDVEQQSEEEDPFMAHAHAASAMEEAIPLTEQLEIPPLMAAPSPKPMAARTAAQAPAPAASMLNNEILMAVSHQISVQLGALSLNGKELLEIGYGSVLPLDRVIGEPVDLVLDNKTIAQAEVVLINGKNLGVRIVALNR